MFRQIVVGGICIFASVSYAAKRELIDSCEAEKASIIAGRAKIISGKKYSGKRAVVLLKGRKLSKRELREASKPALVMKFNLPKGGDYLLFLKGYAPNEGANSFYYSLNGGRLFNVGVKAGKTFTIKRKQRLSDGEHTFDIYSREDNCVIDKLEVYPVIHRRRHLNLKMPDWPTPPFTPPRTRPRVLLNPKYVKILKARIAELPLYKTALERVKYYAHLKDAGVLPKNKMYNSSQSRTIRYQAFLYVLTDSKVEGENAVKNLLVLLKEAKFEKRQDICRSYGELIYSAGIVYDWCYPLLKPADKKAIVAGIMKWAPEMEVGWPPVRQSSITGHAGEAQLLRDLLAAGIAVYDTEPEIYDNCARRFFAEMVPGREFFFKSHRHHQGDSYGPYRFNWAVWAGMLFKRMNGKMVFSEDMGKVPYSWIYARLPDGQTLRDGDTTRSGSFWIAPMRHMGVAGLYRDPYVKYESLFQGADSFARIAPLKFMLFNDPTIKPEPHRELPWSKFFPEPLGSMIARTGWQMGPDSPVAVVEMKGAGYQFSNHQHLDAGTFQIYYKGFLATDGGAYAGLKYGTPFDWSYNKRTIAHNGMLAYDLDEEFSKGDNDGGQRQPNRYRAPKNVKDMLEKGYRNGYIIAHDFGPDKVRPYYSYLSVDLKAAYKPGKLTDYTRTFCFLNFAEKKYPGALIVLDRMTCAKPQTRKIWLLQSLFKPEIKKNTLTVTRTDAYNSGKLVDTILLPELKNIKLEVIGGPGKENWVFGHNYPIPRHNDLSNGWRTQLSPVKPAKSDVFLNVIQIMDAKSKSRPVAKIQTKELLGIKLNHRIVTFPRDGKVIDKAFALPLSKSKTEIQVLLTGLKPGNWNIGNKFRCEVKPESGTAFFVIAPNGSLQIVPGTADSLPEQQRKICPRKEVMPGPRLIINGKRIPLNSMFQKKKSTWIPAEAALTAAGAKTKFDKGLLTVKYQGRTLRIKQNTHRLFINDVKMYLRMPTPVVNGKLYLPVESIASFVMMRATVYFESRCVFLSKFPAARFKYPWYEQVRTNRNNVAHPAVNACDGDLTTYWAGRGRNSYLKFDLGGVKTIKGISIAWYKGMARQAIFAVKVSTGDKKWKTVYNGKSSGKSDKFENYSFPPCQARFVQIIGQGNTSNGFNSILEAAVVPAE
jgi:F5/8 type C domain/Heparinase II C-terminal domain/Copper amine oxidase N-terminal domain